MSKVTPISAAPSYKVNRQVFTELKPGVDLTWIIEGANVHKEQFEVKGELERLEQASSHHLLALLELVHRDEEHQREQAQAREALNQELEAAAYGAFISGVPEEDIYTLDEYTATALESAIRKVQAIA